MSLVKNLVRMPVIVSIFAITSALILLSSFLYVLPSSNQQSAWAGTFPGPNGQIAFTLTDGDDEIYVMNADGSGQTRLTDNTVIDAFPTWSPDGTKIAFTSSDDIFVMNADGSDKTRLTNTGFSEHSPTWSPDGTKIAFHGTRDSVSSEIYVMSAADGTGVIRLTNNAAFDAFPTWSPDGTKIAFTSERDGNLEIYVMSAADGTGVIRLTNNAAEDTTTSWSPDGTKIAFTSFTADESFGIFVMNAADGSDKTKLSVGIDPTWSPDGTKIAFAFPLGGFSEIYVMSAADGTGQTRLTDNGVMVSRPDWGTNTSPAGGSDDTTSPDTVIDSATDSVGNPIQNDTSTASNTITFEFSSPDSDVSKFQCSIDNADWQDCASPVSYANLVAGEQHTFRVMAIDAAGNTDPTPEGFVWTVQEEDTMPPILTIPEDITRQATTANGGTVVTYPVTAEDNADGTAILEEDNTLTQDDDGGDINISCEPASGTEFPIGETVVECTATDAAGNPATASFTVTINPPAPATPAEATEDLISDVENLGGDVPQGTKTSISAPLKEASIILTDDNPNNDKSACGKLDASIRQIDASERRGTLTEQEADDLRTKAEEIRAELGC